MEQYKVEFDPTGQKFVIPLGNSEAVLAYTEINDVWDVHTLIVPDAYSGKGIAEYLTLHVFNTAKEKGIRIIPTCPYVRNKFLKAHPEFNDMIGEYG